MLADFTRNGYGDLLDAFADLGYTSRTFHNVSPNDAHLVLRHDIDYCLEYAIPLAEMEAERNMQSSFYVLLRSEFYNPASNKSLGVIRYLRDLGHDIGLHFDASLYQQDIESLNRACAKECSELECLIDQNVTTVSFHRPTKAFIGMNSLLGGRLHSYQPCFFNDMGYCADSQGRFRYGHPLKHEKVQKRQALQLVTHPVWWYAERAEDPISRIRSFLADKSQLLSDEMAKNSIPYQQHLKDKEA